MPRNPARHPPDQTRRGGQGAAQAAGGLSAAALLRGRRRRCRRPAAQHGRPREIQVGEGGGRAERGAATQAGVGNAGRARAARARRAPSRQLGAQVGGRGGEVVRQTTQAHFQPLLKDGQRVGRPAGGGRDAGQGGRPNFGQLVQGARRAGAGEAAATVASGRVRGGPVGGPPSGATHRGWVGGVWCGGAGVLSEFGGVAKGGASETWRTRSTPRFASPISLSPSSQHPLDPPSPPAEPRLLARLRRLVKARSQSLTAAHSPKTRARA